MLCVDQSGYGVRDQSELLRIMAIPIQVRQDMVQRIAQWHEQRYTVQETTDYYNKHPMDDPTFEWALTKWQEQFPMHVRTKETIAELKAFNSRESKRKAHNLLRGAFNAYLHQECRSPQLARALLKHPTATVNTLLDELKQYFNSKDYLAEKARSQKLDEDNAEAVEKKKKRNAAEIARNKVAVEGSTSPSLGPQAGCNHASKSKVVR